MRKEQLSARREKSVYTKEEKSKDLAGAFIILLVLVTLVPALSGGKDSQDVWHGIQQAQVLN